MERQIDSLNKQKDEQRKASVKTPSVSGPEIAELERLIEQKNQELQKQKESRERQITQLKSALKEPEKEIDEYIKNLTAQIADINKKIDDIKQAERKKNKDLKDADISIPSHLSNPLETAQAKLQSHEASLTSLQSLGKLMKFNESVKTSTTGECKSILNNLCSGLEKFLGYQETSKGYDGTGIVYSDLDRLCDGVMSFILQCLKGSQTLLSFYYPNITQTIKDLEGKIGKGLGLKGFGEAIGIVRDGLQGYESGMEGRINRFKSWYDAMLKNEITELNKEILSFGKKPLKAQLNVVSSMAKMFLQRATFGEKAKNGLDEELREKLDKSVGLVKMAVEIFQKITNDIHVNEAAMLVDAQLDQHEKHINRTVNTVINTLNNQLDVEFKEIFKKLTNLKNEALRTQVDGIRQTVKSAKELVHDCVTDFEKIYEENIIKEFKYIKAQIETFTQTSSPLISIFNNVRNKVMDLKHNVVSDLTKLKGTVNKALRDYVTKVSDAMKNGARSADVSSAFANFGQGVLTQTADNPGVKKLAATLDKSHLKSWFEGVRDNLAHALEGALFSLQQIATMPNSTGRQPLDPKPLIEALQADLIEKVETAFGKNGWTFSITLGQNDVMNEFHAAEQAINGSVSQIGTQLAKLKKLPETINDTSEEAQKIMKDIKIQFTTLQGKIENIEDSVSTADNGLQRAIDALSKAVEQSRVSTISDSEIRKGTLLSQVQQSFSTLTSQVQSLFAKQKQAELTQLQTVVTAQLAEIGRIIAEDKATGVKGFLTRLNEGFDETLDISTLNSNTTLDELASNAKFFFYGLMIYVADQVKTPKPDKTPPKEENDQSRQVDKIRDGVNTLLNKLTHFNKTSTDNLTSLKMSLTNLTPKKFDGNNNKLLDLISDGVGDFIKQLEYAYVSAYSGQQLGDELLIDIMSSVTKTSELTHEGRNCSKAICSIIDILYHAFNDFNSGILHPESSWSSQRIKSTTDFGAFLKRSGYRVPSNRDNNDGELKNKNDMTGNVIKAKIDVRINAQLETVASWKKTDSDIYFMDLLNFLYHVLHAYFRVCHYQIYDRPRQPTTVSHMLQWLSGLGIIPCFPNSKHTLRNYFISLINTKMTIIPQFLPTN
ncbi:hypothetical protein, conserved [Babesia ovata]|uniref:Extracellular matrix-binding ebh n=1 Tax=Babesia ovata TaxID=189622 RepID=A0A2H6KJL7_9APIC|nr:uncharacterized protein BOVATA_046710 [Babesia ovata]GBE63178.1 hypothetical protein, conserved [Babesia ovata]